MYPLDTFMTTSCKTQYTSFVENACLATVRYSTLYGTGESARNATNLEDVERKNTQLLSTVVNLVAVAMTDATLSTARINVDFR